MSAPADTRWRRAVEEKRDALEAIAEAGVPLSDDVAELLRQADEDPRDDG